jgi:hypothetical protein
MHDRKIRIWISSPAESRLNIYWDSDALVQDTLVTASTQHQSIDIDYQQNKTLHIKCCSGCVHVVRAEINYNWEINQFYIDNFFNEVQTLLQSKFDLSKVSADFLGHLKTHDIFTSSGPERFSSSKNLFYNVKIDQLLLPLGNEQYTINSGSEFSANIEHVDIAPIAPQLNNHLLPNKNIQWVSNYNEKFMSTIDTRFYEFINKKIASPKLTWENTVFTGYDLHYGDKIKFQTRLIVNQELIKDKHVVDLGTDRGQTLYPCVLLGCKSVTGVQPLPDRNAIVNYCLQHMKLDDRACVAFGDAYDLDNIKKLLDGKDTLLMLGLLYHLNNHYQLLAAVTDSDITGLVIELSIPGNYLFDHYVSDLPSITWSLENTTDPLNGQDQQSRNNQTWVGRPNAAWVVQTLEFLGWSIKSNVMHSILTTSYPQLKYRGIITAYR